MAINYYEGWSEGDLLAERRLTQNSLGPGRITEVRLAGETVQTAHGRDTTPLEVTLERIAYALYLLCAAGQTAERVYVNPFGGPGVTIQNFL